MSVTEAAKTAFSQTGRLAGTVVLQRESKQRFDELHAALTAEFQPRTNIEAALIDTMAVARWRHLRVLGIQKAGFELETTNHRKPKFPGPSGCSGLQESCRQLPRPDLLHRYEVSL